MFFTMEDKRDWPNVAHAYVINSHHSYRVSINKNNIIK